MWARALRSSRPLATHGAGEAFVRTNRSLPIRDISFDFSSPAQDLWKPCLLLINSGSFADN